MLVPRNQRKVVLQGERGDPEIVIGNWSARTLELYKQPGIVLSGLAPRQQNPNGGLR